MTSYAILTQIGTFEWKISGRAGREILVPTFSDRTVAVQITDAINQAHLDGADELRLDFRTLMNLQRDGDA